MATPKITLYVDIVSPFSYLAYYALRVSFLLAAGGADCILGLLSIDFDSQAQLLFFFSFLTSGFHLEVILQHLAKSSNSLKTQLYRQ